MATPVERLDLTKAGTLTFEAPDEARFPALSLARQALREGGGLPAVMNAANEIAVEAFLDGKLGFLDIAKTVAKTMDQAVGRGLGRVPGDLAGVMDIDREARLVARSVLNG